MAPEGRHVAEEPSGLRVVRAELALVQCACEEAAVDGDEGACLRKLPHRARRRRRPSARAKPA
eukprot:152114-Heterocapsa_arctica.AAC.1